jgi:hypothetical protein
LSSEWGVKQCPLIPPLFYDVIAGTNFSPLQHPKVKSWSPMYHKQHWHTRFVHADAHAVARYAWLCHLKYRITNAVAIANADLAIRDPAAEKFW